jgi:hypothetical protein
MIERTRGKKTVDTNRIELDLKSIITKGHLMKTKYNVAITAQKVGFMGLIGSVGLALEVIVDKYAPGIFPKGLVTALTLTVWTALVNWVKNK